MSPNQGLVESVLSHSSTNRLKTSSRASPYIQTPSGCLARWWSGSSFHPLNSNLYCSSCSWCYPGVATVRFTQGIGPIGSETR